jgi:hypothetical protein
VLLSLLGRKSEYPMSCFFSTPQYYFAIPVAICLSSRNLILP